MNIIEKYNRQFEYAGILMTLLIAFQFFHIWQYPTVGDTPKIITLGLLIIFEFIMVHSGLLMSRLPKKVTLFGLIPFYGLFALAFTAIAQDPLVLFIYLLVVFNRMRFAFSDVPKVLKKKIFIKSLLVAFVYFTLIFPYIFGADLIPMWGMTVDKLEAIGYPGDSDSAGILFGMPHVFIAFGFTYYCILAIIEAFSLRPNFGSPLIKYLK